MADFVFQSEAMVAGKNRLHKIHQETGEGFPAWYYWLTAHSMVHGGVVLLITNNVVLAIIEVVCHWVFDYSKCVRWINFHVDQLLHIVCKLGYALFLTGYI